MEQTAALELLDGALNYLVYGVDAYSDQNDFDSISAAIEILQRAYIAVKHDQFLADVHLAGWVR